MWNILLVATKCYSKAAIKDYVCIQLYKIDCLTPQSSVSWCIILASIFKILLFTAHFRMAANGKLHVFSLRVWYDLVMHNDVLSLV